MQNILAKVPHREKVRFAAHHKKSARRATATLTEDYEKRFPEAIRYLEEGLEVSVSFYDFLEVDKKRISSANGQERLNLEIRRRSRVMGVSPSVESYVCLTICYLICGGLGERAQLHLGGQDPLVVGQAPLATDLSR